MQVPGENTGDNGDNKHATGRIRRWKLWNLPTMPLLYVLAVDLVAVAVVSLAVAGAGNRPQHWDLAALLAVTAVVHLHLSRWTEKIRRDHSHTPHVDLCSVWIFPGALILAPLSATVLVLVIYGHRWWRVGRYDASRPPHRTVFTVAMMLITVQTVVVAAHAFRLDELMITITAVRSWVLLVGVLVVGGLQWTVNTLLLAVIITMTATLKRRRDALGSKSDNTLEGAQLVLGAFVAFVALHGPYLVLLMALPVGELHRTVLLHQLQLAARTDDKTGLLNAVTWQRQVGDEMVRCRQHGTSVALLMMDLDRFKSVNDTYGHGVGDKVLRTLAKMLAASVRLGDSVGRLGGEEFGVLLPGADLPAALTIAERIRNQVHQVEVTYGDNDENVLTGLSLSIGVAVYPLVAEHDVLGLLAAADAAMYQAKEQGRDSVVVAGEQRSNRWLPTEREPTTGDDQRATA
jgi:diguanylate cyclase (GGDEF)-like protein